MGRGGPYRLSARDIFSDYYFGTALRLSGGEENARGGPKPCDGRVIPVVAHPVVPPQNNRIDLSGGLASARESFAEASIPGGSRNGSTEMRS